MKIFKNTPAIFQSGRLLAAVLVLGFAVLTGLSPLLHNHDLDLKEFHKNCAPCHWAHSSTSLDNPVPEITYLSDFQPILFHHDQPSIQNDGLPFSSRSPPAFL